MTRQPPTDDTDTTQTRVHDRTSTAESSATGTSRRLVLRGAGVTGLSALGLFAGAGVTAAQESEFDDFSTVVDVVDAGADNEGTESISPVLEDNRSDDTVFYFPPGEYYMDSQFRFTNFENFGVVGDDATLIPASYHDFDGPRFRLFRLGTVSNPGGDLRFKGITIDQSAPDTGIRTIDTCVSDTLEVRDVLVSGQHDSGTWGPGRFNVVDPDGTGSVVDFRAPDGGQWLHNTPHAGEMDARGPVGISATDTEGQLTFRRCELGAFPGTGLYATGGSGQITVCDGYYANSDTANIRIGGTDSIVRDTTLEVTDSRPETTQQRGIRVEYGNARIEGVEISNTSPLPISHAIAVMNTSTGAEIEDVSIDMECDQVNHGIVVSPDAGETTIQDTEIGHNTAGGYPIWIRESDSSDPVSCTDVTISGTSGDEAGFRDGIRNGRDDSSFVDCTVEQDGRNGTDRTAFVNTGDDVTIEGGTYRASYYPLVERGSETLYAGTNAESYTEDLEAIHLYDESHNVRLIANRLVNGIRDDGSEGLRTVWNSYD